jgi:sugar/nucleoside kinase (ribokinase family)
MTEEKQNVVLIIGSCCMDRLLTVERYPRADEKIRTTSYREEGGGNGSNTAAAMGLLSSASFLKEKKLRIKFLGKVGADVVGDQLIHELNDSFNVDTSSPLFRRGEAGTTTGITNVIVSEDEHTRTCIHTPGTCGELTIEEAKAVDMDEIFRDVVHFHSDSRHTEVSVYLAEQAQLRGIPVSCDSERDRGTRFQDRLVEICDTLFCNSDYLADYLGKLNREHESRNGCQSLPEPQIELKGDGLSQTSVNIHAKALLPSAFFSRWHSQGEKEVIVSQ